MAFSKEPQQKRRNTINGYERSHNCSAVRTLIGSFGGHSRMYWVEFK
jgi:hypothetical protein